MWLKERLAITHPSADPSSNAPPGFPSTKWGFGFPWLTAWQKLATAPSKILEGSTVPAPCHLRHPSSSPPV